MSLLQCIRKVNGLDKQRKRIRARIYRLANPLVAKVIAEFNKTAPRYGVIEHYHIVLQPCDEPEFIGIEIRSVSPRRRACPGSNLEPGLEGIEYELFRFMRAVAGTDHRLFRVSLSPELFGK
jgi:hypothetical protein